MWGWCARESAREQQPRRHNTRANPLVYVRSKRRASYNHMEKLLKKAQGIFLDLGQWIGVSARLLDLSRAFNVYAQHIPLVYSKCIKIYIKRQRAAHIQSLSVAK